MSADRARKLVALASSPVEEEARTAAYLACRVIREEGLLVLAPDDPKLLGSPSPAPSWRPARPEPAPRPAPPVDPWKEHGRHGAPHATWPPDPEPRPKGRRKKGPQPAAVVLEASAPCAGGRHSIDAGRRGWRMPDGRLLCGLCFNGCP